MKLVPEQVTFFLHQHSVRRNLLLLCRFCLMIIGIICVFSFLFHVIMLHEGQRYSWFSGVYWTLTVMSTLGFGDITFTSDLGKIFTMVVLVCGVFLIIIIFPFTFIQFFYQPWLKAQEKERTPRALPKTVRDHVIIVSTSPIALNLADELTNYGSHCVILCHDAAKTLDLLDQGYSAVAGEHDATQTYVNLRLKEAALLVALENDVRNTNIIFTARDVAPGVDIVASAQSDDALDILRLAGSTRIYQFHKLLGEALARRVLNINMRFSIVSRFKELVVAEGPVMRTSLVDKTLRESNLRVTTGANVVGLWERGSFVLPTPDTVFTPTMVMVIVGDMQQIQSANSYLGEGALAGPPENPEAPVLVIGAGRVGTVAAKQLERSKRNFCVVDKVAKKGFIHGHQVVGDAADKEVLVKAGINTAPTVIITTHDDDTNIYLTLYCRRLREDIQIISRATLDRNVGILHAAGADLVLSLASIVSSSIINRLSPGKVMMINEGLNIFRSTVDKSLVGKQLMGSGIRATTHCSVVAIRDKDGSLHANPEPTHIFEAAEEIYLIGDSESEKLFYDKYGKNLPLS